MVQKFEQLTLDLQFPSYYHLTMAALHAWYHPVAAREGCCRGEKSLKMILKFSKKNSKIFVDKKSFWEFFQIFGAIF
jgi:hypothetical protein